LVVELHSTVCSDHMLFVWDVPVLHIQ